ncbi:MAG: hypothetical protein WCP97_07525 [bacterium]
MFEENKNLKDPTKNSAIKDTSSSVPAPYQNTGYGGLSYTKTDKLITALYMVTDIIESGEPLRNKLRTAGVEIISDIRKIEKNNIGHLAHTISGRISEILSFLEIAGTINIISEMNASILRKEFLELSQSIKDSTGSAGISDRRINLIEFFKEPEFPLPLNKGENERGSLISDPYPASPLLRGRGNHKGHDKGHQSYTRIGVQKGSTLMKAIKDMSNRASNLSGVGPPNLHAHDFDLLKKQRREDITNIIKMLGGSATIKDIKDQTKTVSWKASTLVTCSEKTLQRELVSMVRDGVLNKTGEKRWSRYITQGNPV